MTDTAPTINDQESLYFMLGIHRVRVWVSADDPHYYEWAATYDPETGRYNIDNGLIKRISDSLEVRRLSEAEFFAL